MFNFHLFKLEVKIGENFWVTVAGTTGSIVCCYLIYRYISSKRYVKDTSKKCVFITGCDKGFGRLLAKRLDSMGVPVFAGCRTNEAKLSLQKECSPSLQPLVLDITSSQDIAQAAEFVKSNLSAPSDLWAVVNSVGIIGTGGPVEFQKRLDFEEVMQVNFLGMVDVNNAFFPLIKRSRGRIVNMCSMVAKSPTPLNVAYVASKYAVLGYSVALRREKAMWGISVSTIMPSLYSTESINMDKIRTLRRRQWQEVSEEVKEEYGEGFDGEHLKRLERMKTNMSIHNMTSVIDATEHALFSVSPQKNYMVGRGTGMLAVLESLPSVMDWVSSKTMDIHPKALEK